MAPVRPSVRPPVQQRSRATLERILQAGVDLLIEGGWNAVTVSEVARRANVSIGTLYGRFDNRESLLLAIHDRVISDIEYDKDVAFNDPQWSRVDASQAVEAAVTAMASIFIRHQDVLRALTARTHFDAEITRRGVASAMRLGDEFTRVLLPYSAAFTHENPERAIRFLFDTCVDACSRQLVADPESEFGARPRLSWEETTAELQRVASAYLLL